MDRKTASASASGDTEAPPLSVRSGRVGVEARERPRARTELHGAGVGDHRVEAEALVGATAAHRRARREGARRDDEHLLVHFAVDYELASHLTFGAAAFVSWNSISTSGGSELSGFGFGLAPRVGYTLGLTDRLSFWPRAGVTLAYMSASPDGTTGTVSVTSKVTYVPLWVNLEPMLVYAVDPHFSFTLALVCDLPLLGAVTSTTRTTVGSVSTERTTESSVTQLIVAAQIGVMGRF